MFTPVSLFSFALLSPVSHLICISCLPSSLLFLTLFSGSPIRGYLVAAPSVFRVAVEESVSVTIFNGQAETRVQAQLSMKGQTVAHSHSTVRGEDTVLKA